MTSISSATLAGAPVTGPSRPTVRLRPDPKAPGKGILDGGWWPRSTNPSAELPELIASLDSRLGEITRVMLNMDVWDDAPRLLQAGGRRIHVGWYHTFDAHTISLTNIDRERFLLLVVPPGTPAAAAGTALEMAADGGPARRPATILAASDIAA
jgi:hypothetical protein